MERATAVSLMQFLSTPSARRATVRVANCGGRLFISIHALREEGDLMRITLPSSFRISIHALREEGDAPRKGKIHLKGGFLSTPSARRATKGRFDPDRPHKFLSTPSARRATGEAMGKITFLVTFLSTPSARRATTLTCLNCSGETISIHALREEGDPGPGRRGSGTATFLSTPSARRATQLALPSCRAPLHFYPRPPRGGRPSSNTQNSRTSRFLSTPSARRATAQVTFDTVELEFLSTPSARRATGRSR